MNLHRYFPSIYECRLEGTGRHISCFHPDYTPTTFPAVGHGSTPREAHDNLLLWLRRNDPHAVLACALLAPDPEPHVCFSLDSPTRTRALRRLDASCAVLLVLATLVLLGQILIPLLDQHWR